MADEPENTEQQEAPEADKQPMDPVRKWTLIILGICAFLLCWHLRSDRVTPLSTQATVHALVVPLASEVSGTITSVSVSNNQRVMAGQVLFQIDTERYEYAIQTAQANLDSARQATGASTAGVDAAAASLTSARAGKVQAEQDAVRMRNIREEEPGAISIRRLELADAGLAMAEGGVSAAEANLEKAIQDLGAAGEDNSRILQAQAAMDQALLDLERATVRAPEDGVVTGVRLDKGNYVAAGAPQVTFIATHNIWGQADFTENNLEHIDPGDGVDIIFDVLPGRVFEGTVREIGFGVAVDSAALGSLPTITNDTAWLRDSQRFPVLINFDIPETNEGRTRLKVGAQTTVVVYTGNHWLFNFVSGVYMRVASLLSYAY